MGFYEEMAENHQISSNMHFICSSVLAFFQTFPRFPNLCVQHITRKKAADVLAQRIMDAMLLDRKIHSGDFNNVPELTS